MHPTFRIGTAADVPALVALIDSAYRGESSRAGWTTEADLLHGSRTVPEEVAKVVTSADSLVLIAEQDTELVACAQLEYREGHAYFGMFAVRPTVQGTGLGKLVLAEAERRALVEWSADAMHMTVLRQRADLIAWYERRGYRRTGQYRPFPYGDERFGIPQRTDLEFELLVKPLLLQDR